MVKLKYIDIQTKDGRKIKLNEVGHISLGIDVPKDFIPIFGKDRNTERESVIIITAKEGHMKFDLEDVNHIKFVIQHDKKYLYLTTTVFPNEEVENGKGK